MRVSTSQIYDTGINGITRNQASMLKTQTQITTGRRVLTPSDDPVGLLGSLRADAYHPGLEGLERAAVEAARNAGYGVNVWTVNEKDDMRRLLEWGVSGIFTDFPDRLVEVLAE